MSEQTSPTPEAATAAASPPNAAAQRLSVQYFIDLFKNHGPELQIPLKPKKCAIVFAIGLILWFLPCPETINPETGKAFIDPKGWKIMACFVATIASFLTGAMPMGVAVLLAVTVLGTLVLPVKDALSGFASAQVWLIVMAFLISRGFVKTGLGLRIAYLFIKKLGSNPRGLALALGLTCFGLGSAMPSSTARAGTFMALIKSIAQGFGSTAEHDRRKIGSYLMFCGFSMNYPTSASYMTAMAGNPLIIAFAAAAIGEGALTWFKWWLWMLVPGILCLVVTPWVISWIYPPQLKKSTEAQEMAKQKLAEMGPMNSAEWLMLFAFILLLLLWVGGSFLGLNATIAAFIGIMFLLLTGVLSWDDVTHEHSAYNCMFWYAGLLVMAPAMSKYGIIAWLTKDVNAWLHGMDWIWVIVILVMIIVEMSYVFASSTAFISALYPAFLGIALAANVPADVAAISLAAVCNLKASMTYYTGGAAPVYFFQNFVTPNEWLRNGFIITHVHVLILLTVGMMWWKVLGLW